MKDRTDPTNVDSVPAMLTPGEFVLNKEASQMYAKEAEAMNNHGLQIRDAENQAVGMNTGGSLPTLPTAYNQGGFVDFLKKHEGWKDKAYKDSGGVWTIGFGRTMNDDGSKVKSGQSTTKKAENSWLDKRAKKDYDATSKYLKDKGYDFNDNQINALASFRYNGGQGMLNQLTDNGTRDLATIQAKMPLYNKAGGKAIEGLTNRRNAELELFNTPWEAPAEKQMSSVVGDDAVGGAFAEAILGGGADKQPMVSPPQMMMEMPPEPGPLPGELVMPQNEQVMLPPPPPPTSGPPPVEETGELGLGGLEQYTPPPPGHANAVKEEAGWFNGVSDTFSNFFNNDGGLIHANRGRRVPKQQGSATEFDPVAFLKNKKNNSKQKGPGRGKKLQRTIAESIKDAEDLSQDNQDTLKAFWQFLQGNSTVVPKQLEQKIDEVEEIIPDLEIPPAEENDLYQTFAGGYGDVPPTPKKGETPEEAQQRVWEQEDAADYNQTADWLDQPDSGYLAGQEGVPYIPSENQDYNQIAGLLDQPTEGQQQNYGPEGFQNMIDPQLTGEGYQPEGFVDAAPSMGPQYAPEGFANAVPSMGPQYAPEGFANAVPSMGPQYAPEGFTDAISSMGPQYAPEGFADAVPSMGPQYAPEGFTDAVSSMGPQYAPEGFTDATPSQVAPDYAPEGFTDAIPSSYTPPEEFGRQLTADDMARENLAAIHEERKNDWIPLNERGAREDVVGFNKQLRDLDNMPQQGVVDDTQNYGPEGFQNQIEPQQIEAAIEEEEEAVRAETLGLPIPDTTNVDAVGDALQESMPVPQPETFTGGRGEYTPTPQNYESSLAQNMLNPMQNYEPTMAQNMIEPQQIPPEIVQSQLGPEQIVPPTPTVDAGAMHGPTGMAYTDFDEQQLQAMANGGDPIAQEFLTNPPVEGAAYYGPEGFQNQPGYIQNYGPEGFQNQIEPIQNFESSLAQNMIAPMQNYEPTMAQNQIAPMQNYEPTMAQNAPGYIQNYGPEGFQNMIEPQQIPPPNLTGGADAMARDNLKAIHEQSKNDYMPFNEKGPRQDVVGFNKQLRDVYDMPQAGVVDDTQNYGPAGFQNQIEPQQNYESSLAQNQIDPQEVPQEMDIRKLNNLGLNIPGMENVDAQGESLVPPMPGELSGRHQGMPPSTQEPGALSDRHAGAGGDVKALSDENLGKLYDQGNPAAVAEVDRREQEFLLTEKLQQNRLDQAVAGSEGDGSASEGQKFLQEQEASLLGGLQELSDPGLGAFGGTGIPKPGMDAFGGLGTVPLPEEGMGYDGVNAEGMSMYDEVVTDAPVAKADPNTQLQIAQKGVQAKTIMAEADAQMAQAEDMFANAATQDEVDKATRVAKNAQTAKAESIRMAEEADAAQAEVDAQAERAANNQAERVRENAKEADAAQVAAWQAKKDLGIPVGPKPKPKSISDEIDPAPPTVAQSKQDVSTAVDKITEEQARLGEDTAPMTTAKKTAAKAASKNATEEQKHEGFKAVKEGFGDMFDSKELGRMALLFAGALLTGSTPGQALKFAGMNYIQRMDAKETNQTKRIDGLVKGGKYTTGSIKAYAESGDASDLMPTSEAATLKTLGTQKEFYTKGGQRILAQGVEKSDGSKGWVKPDGTFVNLNTEHQDPVRVKGTKEYDKKILAESKVFSESLEQLREQFGTFKTDEGDQYSTDLVPHIAGRNAAKWAAENDVPAADMGELFKNAYQAAVEDSKGGAKVQSITAYLNNQRIQSTTGAADLFKLPNGSTAPADKVQSVINNMIARAPGLTGSDVMKSTTIVNLASQEWTALDQDERDEYNKLGPNKGLSGFLAWMQEQYEIDVK